MLFADLRASAWKYASIACAVLAVAALVACLFFWGRLGHALVRADAAESRAKALASEVAALKEAGKRDDQSADATKAARDAAAKRQPEQQARAAKVKGYADSAVQPCAADPRIVSELREGTDRFNSGSDRLRGQ